MTEPVTLAQAKEQCRVIGKDEDFVLEQLIVAARVHIERATGQTLVERRVAQVFDGFASPMRLAAWPIAATADLTVEYRDPASGDWAQVTPVPVVLDGRYPAQVTPAFGTSAWPGAMTGPQNVRVTLTAGYPDDDCPAPLRQAMLLLIGHWYANREAAVVATVLTDVAFGVGLLTEDYRRLQ